MKKYVIRLYNIGSVPAVVIHELCHIMLLLVFRIPFKIEVKFNDNWKSVVHIHTQIIYSKVKMWMIALAPLLSLVLIPVFYINEIVGGLIIRYYLLYIVIWFPSLKDLDAILEQQNKINAYEQLAETETNI